MKFVIAKILLVICIISYSKADLPVHCLKSQIQGKWTFHLTKAKEIKLPELYKFSCGHQSPSNEKTSYEVNESKKLNGLNFSNTKAFELHGGQSVKLKNENVIIN
jgi:hypothetical protein